MAEMEDLDDQLNESVRDAASDRRKARQQADDAGGRKRKRGGGGDEEDDEGGSEEVRGPQDSAELCTIVHMTLSL